MKNILLMVFVIGLVVLSGCGVDSSQNTINVRGESERTYEPDMAEIYVGVTSVKENAKDAQFEVNKGISDIVDALLNAGIGEKEISTEQLNLNEDWSWEEGKRQRVGWRASQTLKIKTLDLTKVGMIVDIAVENGANQINSINFGLTSEKEQLFKKEALADATINAKEKAEVIAESLGVRLGKIKSVSESNYYARPYMYAMDAKIGVAAVEEASMILPGDVQVTGRINVVYIVR